MFKKILKKLTISLIIIQAIISIFSISAYATTQNVNPNNLIPKEQKLSNGSNESIKNIANLPDITIEEGFGITIKTILKVCIYLTIIAIVVAAIYYLISFGEEENITKARNIILYLVIGMAIISSAYAIGFGLSKFNFFQ